MEKTTQDTSRKRKPSRLIESYFAQCGKCDKYRSIESQEEYEEIRSEALNKSFECKNSCEEAGDVDVEHDSSRIWFLDHQHGLPKTPQGLKRIMVLRERGDQADVYYLTPQGKRLRSCREVAGFIQDNESFKGTNIEDISFATPKLMKKKTNSEDVARAKTKDKKTNGNNRRLKKKSQVSNLNSDETSARTDGCTKGNDQKIPLTLENGEPSEKTAEAETHTHKTLREDKPLGDVERSPAKKGCDILSKKKQNKESVVMNSDEEEEKHMPDSLQNEKQTTDKRIESSNLSKKKKKRDNRKKTSGKKKQAIDDNDRDNEKDAGAKKPLVQEITSNEVIIEEIEKGKLDGEVAVQGKKVSILYTGKLKDTGKLFESNLEEAPLRFRLGGEKVIKGLRIGVEGMRVGDKRRLIIPPSLGYSEEGPKEAVPKNAWLVYEVEAVKVR